MSYYSLLNAGGAQTKWFMTFDDRVKVAAPCSFITIREREYELNGTGDGCRQIHYEGKERLETAALMTSVPDRRISALELSETIKSFTVIAEKPLEKDWYSYVVPGILCFFDLPDLAAMRPDMTIKYLK